MKYKFVIKKIQYAYVEDQFDSDTTIEQAMEKLAQLGEDELNFSEPEYHLEVITKEIGKVSKIIWKNDSCF
jgi:hypothetical protein